MRTGLVMLLLMMVTTANALDVLDYLTDAEGKYNGPTVEQKVAEMDTDNNGFADVYEIRAYLVNKHGENYQKEVLGRWEANANPNSCGTVGSAEDFVADQ